MNKRAISALVAGFCLALSGAAFSQTTLTAAVDHSIKNAPDIATDARFRRSVDEALLGSYAAFLPSLDAGWGYGREKGLSSSTAGKWSERRTRHEKSLTAQWNIFQSFGAYFEVERNRARMASAAHATANTSEQVALRVVESYLDVLRLRETVRLTKQNRDNHQKTYDQIQMRASSGVGRQSDLEQAEARLALAKSNLVSSEANLRDAEIAFQRYTGLRPDQLQQPSPPEAGLLPSSLEGALSEAHLSNPAYKQSQADVAAAEAQYQTAKSPFGPRFDIEGGLVNNDNVSGLQGPSYDHYAMLRMRWNLFRGGADTARLGETKQLSYQALEISKRTLMQLDQSTALSWNTLASVRERLPHLKKHVDSSLATRDAYTLQFSIGQRTLIDLLDTENEYYTATVEYVNGQYLEIFACYRLMADMGRLLRSLHVQPLQESVPTERVGWTNPWSRSDYAPPRQIPVSSPAQQEEAALVPETPYRQQSAQPQTVQPAGTVQPAAWGTVQPAQQGGGATLQPIPGTDPSRSPSR
ncbi:MAG: TolC family outer membrane protein [Burkholderiaceae bacterium]|nr:TolC family outer membrane protein [Burkholderiaceae bacterium]